MARLIKWFHREPILLEENTFCVEILLTIISHRQGLGIRFKAQKPNTDTGWTSHHLGPTSGACLLSPRTFMEICHFRVIVMRKTASNFLVTIKSWITMLQLSQLIFLQSILNLISFQGQLCGSFYMQKMSLKWIYCLSVSQQAYHSWIRISIVPPFRATWSSAAGWQLTLMTCELWHSFKFFQ